LVAAGYDCVADREAAAAREGARQHDRVRLGEEDERIVEREPALVARLVPAGVNRTP